MEDQRGTFFCLTTNAEHGLQSLNCMLFKKAKTRILVSHIVKEYSDYTSTIHFKQVLLWSPIIFSDSTYIANLFQCKVVFLELVFWYIISFECGLLRKFISKVDIYPHSKFQISQRKSVEFEWNVKTEQK